VSGSDDPPERAQLSNLLGTPDEEARRADVGRGTGANDVTPGARVMLRGIARRCPRCGQGKLFSRWFTMARVCPRCGLLFEREEGGFLGAIVINYTVALVAWGVLLVLWLAIDLPDLHVVALTIASIALVVGALLLFYPFSKTIWAAVEYLIYRSEMRQEP
jgi:uncharacterized protein (DUF983 family)